MLTRLLRGVACRGLNRLLSPGRVASTRAVGWPRRISGTSVRDIFASWLTPYPLVICDIVITLEIVYWLQRVRIGSYLCKRNLSNWVEGLKRGTCKVVPGVYLEVGRPWVLSCSWFCLVAAYGVILVSKVERRWCQIEWLLLMLL